MPNCIITLGEESVNMFSHIDLLSRFNRDELINAHPSLRFDNGQTDTFYELVYDEQPGSLIVSYERNRVCVTGPWDLLNEGQLLVYAVYPFVELQRQEKSLITAHAAVYRQSGTGIALFGNIGAGKSSVLLDACLKHGGHLVGNDISVIGLKKDSLFCRGGAQDFILRYESMRRNLPELLGHFPVNPTDPWSTKIKLTAAKLGILTCTEGCIIDQAYLVRVDDRMTDCFAERRSDVMLKIMLNENFSRYIRGSCLMLLGGQHLDCQGFIPSFDRPDLAAFRYEVIKRLLERMVYIAGPLDKVVQVVTQAAEGGDQDGTTRRTERNYR